MPKISKKAVKRYEAFRGYRPRRVTQKRVEPVLELVELAQPEYITYFSDKFHGGGDGKMAAYKHKFGKRVKMYCTPDGKMLVIMGAGMSVQKRGIVG